MEKETEQAIHTCRLEITKSSPARILEEILRMLESGASAPFLRLLAEYQVLNILFPILTQALKTPHGKMIFHYLACADQLYKHKGKNVLDRSINSLLIISHFRKRTRTAIFKQKANSSYRRNYSCCFFLDKRTFNPIFFSFSSSYYFYNAFCFSCSISINSPQWKKTLSRKIIPSKRF
jgi:tRNA nucleotidyltransferase/poly(A) polymerase